MSEAKWSPEPWTLRAVPCEDPACGKRCANRFPNFAISARPWDELATVYGRADDPAGQAEGAANARRAVACVNACAGIPTEALEGGALADLLSALDRWGKESGLDITPGESALALALVRMNR